MMPGIAFLDSVRLSAMTCSRIMEPGRVFVKTCSTILSASAAISVYDSGSTKPPDNQAAADKCKNGHNRDNNFNHGSSVGYVK